MRFVYNTNNDQMCNILQVFILLWIVTLGVEGAVRRKHYVCCNECEAGGAAAGKGGSAVGVAGDVCGRF